jgi:hypothetical protein
MQVLNTMAEYVTPSSFEADQATAKESALRLIGVVLRVIGGALVVVLGGVGSGFLGGFIADVLSEDDQNVGLNVAFFSIIAGAAGALGLLAWVARTGRQWGSLARRPLLTRYPR